MGNKPRFSSELCIRTIKVEPAQHTVLCSTSVGYYRRVLSEFDNYRCSCLHYLLPGWSSQCFARMLQSDSTLSRPKGEVCSTYRAATQGRFSREAEPSRFRKR